MCSIFADYGVEENSYTYFAKMMEKIKSGLADLHFLGD